MRAAAVLPADTPDCPLNSVTDVVVLLAATINQVRRGELDSKAANTIGYLSTVLHRCLADADLERRVAALEAKRSVQQNGRVAT